jgi:single-stranded DNA-binding protein
VAAVREAPPTPERREAERLTLIGRVGRDPTYWTTKTGVARAHFPLGVRHDPASDTTTWHRIDAWNKWAERARDTVHRGEVVEAVVYRRVTTVEGTRGPRQVEELRAAAIRHPDKKQ